MDPLPERRARAVVTADRRTPPRLSVVGVERENARNVLREIQERGLYPLDRIEVAHALAREEVGFVACPPEDLSGEVFLVLGGDGTFLRAAHLARGQPLAGVNLGALGFLTLYSLEELPRLLEAIRTGAWTVESRSGLEVRLPGETLIAYNDLVVRSSMPSRLVRVQVRVGEGERLFDFFADGVIVATPTGSTAYNLSVMGPVLFPRIQGVVVTPLAAHTLSARPVVLPSEVVLEIVAWSKHGEEVLAIVDGLAYRTLPSGNRLEVTVSEGRLNLLRTDWAPGFFDVLRRKLRWG